VDFRTFLIQIYERLKAQNPAYSRRAFARDLKVDVAHLHRVMKGEMRPSPLIAFSLGKFLKLKCEDSLMLIEVTVEPEKKLPMTITGEKR
jgi:hypothetical protein